MKSNFLNYGQHCNVISLSVYFILDPFSHSKEKFLIVLKAIQIFNKNIFRKIHNITNNSRNLIFLCSTNPHSSIRIVLFNILFLREVYCNFHYRIRFILSQIIKGSIRKLKRPFQTNLKVCSEQTNQKVFECILTCQVCFRSIIA